MSLISKIFLDNNRLICCGRRIHYASTTDLLPFATHHFSELLLIIDTHEKLNMEECN